MEKGMGIPGFLIDRVITRIGDYEVDAERLTYNGFIQSITLALGNGQSIIRIHTTVSTKQKSNEALELLKEFWTSLESRGKDFDYGHELAGPTEPEGNPVILDVEKTAKLWAKAEPRYYAQLVTTRFPGYKSMEFRLFHASMTEGELNKLVVLAPGHKTILESGYTPSAIEQTFSKAEICQLQDFFKKSYEGDRFTAQRAAPPDNDCLGYGAQPCGGGCDHYPFDEIKGYSLPFKVWGFFDRHQAELKETKEVAA